jgi:TPR repeat protein
VAEERCAAGYAAACDALAEKDLSGQPQNLPRAHQLLRRSCDELRDGHGCDKLGELYLLGLGVPEDLPRALALFDRACDRGYAPACARLGILYIEGIVDHDYRPDPRGTVYMRRACEGGDAAACLYYGDFLEQGRGVAKDPQRAMEYFHRSCKEGDSRGCDAAARRR